MILFAALSPVADFLVCCVVMSALFFWVSLK